MFDYVERIENIVGIGPKALTALAQYFADPVSRKIFTELLQHIVVENSKSFQPKAPAFNGTTQDQAQSGEANTGSASAAYPLKGKKVVITGFFRGLTRVEVEEKVVALGGCVTKTITKNVDLLLTASTTKSEGAKVKKALALGIATMTEHAFVDILNTFSEPIER